MTLADLVSNVPHRVERSNGRVLCEEWVNGKQCGQPLSASNKSSVNRPRCRRHDHHHGDLDVVFTARKFAR